MSADRSIPGVTQQSSADELRRREALMHDIAPLLVRYGYDAATVVLFTPDIVNVQSVGAEGKAEACTFQAQQLANAIQALAELDVICRECWGVHQHDARTAN